MAVVRMYIDKFSGVVLIDEGHPLAIAQKEKKENSRGAGVERTATHSVKAITAAATVAPAPVVVSSPPRKRRK